MCCIQISSARDRHCRIVLPFELPDYCPLSYQTSCIFFFSPMTFLWLGMITRTPLWCPWFGLKWTLFNLQRFWRAGASSLTARSPAFCCSRWAARRSPADGEVCPVRVTSEGPFAHEETKWNWNMWKDTLQNNQHNNWEYNNWVVCKVGLHSKVVQIMILPAENSAITVLSYDQDLILILGLLNKPWFILSTFFVSGEERESYNLLVTSTIEMAVVYRSESSRSREKSAESFVVGLQSQEPRLCVFSETCRSWACLSPCASWRATSGMQCSVLWSSTWTLTARRRCCWGHMDKWVWFCFFFLNI